MEYNFDDWYISEDNIKIDLKETEFEGVGWIYLFQHKSHWQALMSTIVTFRVPYNTGYFLIFWRSNGVLRWTVLCGLSYVKIDAAAQRVAWKLV